MALSRNFIVPLVVACAFFMEQIDGSIIATAVPKIAEALHTDPLHLNLAITCYMFSLAVFIPLSGWIADRFGARNIFRLSIVIFVAASLSCGLSNSLWQLVASRIVQGIGGAMMMPVGRLVILRTVPKNKLVDAIALMSTPALMGPVLGPPLGGLIVTYASWRWIFLINVPIGIVGFLLATRYMENFRVRKRETLDFSGFVMMAITLAGLVVGFETIGRDFVATWVILTVIASAAVSFALYLRHARQLRFPIVDLRLLKYRTFRCSLTGGSMFRIAIGAMPFLLPLMLQYGYGTSPVMSGLITLAGAAGAGSMKIFVKPIVKAIGFRPLLVGNSVLNTIFFIGCAFFTPHTPLSFIFVFLLIGGIFRSIQFTALNSVAYADIPPFLLSRANTLYTMMQQLTLSLGVAVGALALSFTMKWNESSTLRVQDFWPAWVALAVMSQLSILAYLRLEKNAGAMMSGHRAKEPPETQPVGL